MDFQTEIENSALISHLKGILDADGVVSMIDEIKLKAPGEPPRVILDFNEIDALDPMGLVEILQLSTWLKDQGGRLRVYGAATHVETAFRDNMISDVDFFADADAAKSYATIKKPEPVKEEPKINSPAPPKKKTRKKSLLPFILGFLGFALLVGIGFLAKEILAPKNPLFEMIGADAGKDLKIAPGETADFQVKVLNAEQIVSPPNPDWVTVDIKNDGENQWIVHYTLTPSERFSETTKLYFYASKGAKRYSSPEIYIQPDIKPTPPEFVLSGRDQATNPAGKKGYLLNPGQISERYGPDGIHATGGANIRYTAKGHEQWGLRFDKKTGRFTGTPTKATADNEYAEITVTADNNQGTPVTTTLFLTINAIPEGNPDFAFAEEIDKRFVNIDHKSLSSKNIMLLFTYKDAIRDKGSNGIHKVSTVYFGLGEKVLSYENKRKLDEEFQDSRFIQLAKKPDSYFFVLGYADKGKTADSVNKAIINSRANVMRDYLTNHLKNDLDFSDERISNCIKTIPMLPLSGEGDGKIFESAERSRAGEIWVVGDPRK